jgi:hypothetical protein
VPLLDVQIGRSPKAILAISDLPNMYMFIELPNLAGMVNSRQVSSMMQYAPRGNFSLVTRGSRLPTKDQRGLARIAE